MSKIEKWECDMCESEFDSEGHTENFYSECGKNVCEDCKDTDAVCFDVEKSGCREAFFGSARRGLEQIDTGYHKTRKEAKDRIIEMAKAVWGQDAVFIEE